MAKRILIIDDEEHIRRMMRLTLETAGYQVGEAADGPEGLDLFADGSHWVAVILDQRMPDMDGLDMCLKISNQTQFWLLRDGNGVKALNEDGGDKTRLWQLQLSDFLSAEH